MAKLSGIKAPTFFGRTDEDADSFINAFERYTKYRDITEADKKLNLFAVLLHDSAAKWFDGLSPSAKDTFDHLTTAFAERYRLPASRNFQYAADLFNRKQAADQTVDDYVTQMRKTARLIDIDDKILHLVLVNGFLPAISAHVIRSKTESIDQLLDVARLAELTIPTTSDSTIGHQITDLQSEIRRLSTKMDNAVTAAIHPRSPTPERRVHFDTPTFSSQPASSFPTSASGYGSHPPPDPAIHYTQRPTRSPVTWQRQPPPSSWQPSRQQKTWQSQQPTPPPSTPCTRCARLHGRNSFCPARDPNRVCNYCHKPGHFQAACFSAPTTY